MTMTMRDLLMINPNTSEQVTALLRAKAQPLLPSSVMLHAVTAPFGAPYIASEVSYAVAGHAVLAAHEAWCQSHGEPDAILIGCFGDPGLWALREAAQVSVVGLAEASMRQAARAGRFAIVTGGTAWGPMLHRLAQALGFGQQLSGVHTVAASGAELAADPQRASTSLAEACAQALQAGDVRCIIIGGAGLAGFASQLADGVPVPLIDSVTAGVQACVAALG